MSRFTDGRQFALFVGGLSLSFLSATALIDPSVSRVRLYYSAPLLAVAAVACLVASVDNHGRGRSLESRLRRTTARILVAPIKPCGCWREADADTVDTDAYVRRREDGSRVVLEARRSELRRCHVCGRHYHVVLRGKLRGMSDLPALKDIGETDTYGMSICPDRVSVWPEDEPAAREAIDVPIEDA